jgi:hypothetical protein
MSVGETEDVIRAQGRFDAEGQISSYCHNLRGVDKTNVEKFRFANHKDAICFTVLSRMLLSRISWWEHAKDDRCRHKEILDISSMTGGIDRGNWALLVIADFLRRYDKGGYSQWSSGQSAFDV